MQFSEDDLRAALKRKDPGAGFAQRVMARISQKEVNQKETAHQDSPAPGRRPGWWPVLRIWPALAGVLAVLLLMVGSWLGYRQYQSVQQARAQRAEQQAVLALRITSAKLNLVLQRVDQQQTSAPKVRRETL
ncbi:MAG: hypothetical protein ACRD4F_16165 [Candidatus Angelobacter sp.]